jgi:Fur family peroxide stress response transcriptional regulator
MQTSIDKLRTRGLAVTPQRLAVMASLENRYDHPTAEMIFQSVRRQLPTISCNTIYKTLETLYDHGLIIKVNPLHEVARYDGHTEPHAHLVCRQCHYIGDIPWNALRSLNLPTEALAGFQVEYPALTLWGLCPQCQAESPKQEE